MLLFFKRSYFLLPLIFTISGCNPPKKGNGNIVTRERAVSGFERIEIRGNYDVTLAGGNEEGVTIETDENLQDLIELSVANNILVIQNTEHLVSSENIKVRIRYKTISGISSSGASIIGNERILSADKLDLDFPGTGMVNLEIEVEELNVDMKGAGLLKLIGYANRQKVDMKGAGNYNANDLTTNETVIELDGIGSAEVYARESLRAQLNGVGSIKYRGSPAKLEKEVNGLGVIKPAEEETENIGI